MLPAFIYILGGTLMALKTLLGLLRAHLPNDTVERNRRFILALGSGVLLACSAGVFLENCANNFGGASIVAVLGGKWDHACDCWLQHHVFLHISVYFSYAALVGGAGMLEGFDLLPADSIRLGLAVATAASGWLWWEHAKMQEPAFVRPLHQMLSYAYAIQAGTTL